MDRDKLLVAEAILRRGRERLVEDFLGEHPDIYAPAFAHQDFPQTMKLCIEHYMGRWVAKHWATAFELVPDPTPEQRAFFDRLIQELARARLPWMEDQDVPSTLRDLINVHSAQLEAILEIANRSSENAKALQYALAKEDALYQRLLKSELAKRDKA
ncbi:hypothetical protein [Cupriavidus sp. H18C2]|uniref:hypothetical protein n=1 Tax=Cupriavidus sp. H18C2 TaxID=3241602 RepID=UPI003BF826E0